MAAAEAVTAVETIQAVAVLLHAEEEIVNIIHLHVGREYRFTCIYKNLNTKL